MDLLKKHFKIKLTIYSLLLICLFTLSSCKKNNTLDNVIAIGYINEDIYLINKDNKSLCLDNYDLIQENLDTYMYVRKNNLYGYININGQLIIKPSYDKAFAMKESKAVVVKDNKYFIINNKGKTIYTLPEGIISYSYFSNNKLLIEKDGKYSFLTYEEETNSFILPDEFLYDYACAYSDGYAVVGKEIIDENDNTNINIKYNYLNIDNNLLFSEFKFDEADSFKNGFAKVGIFTKNVQVYYSTSSYYYKNVDLMVYKYIDTTGNYIKDSETKQDLVCHYGTTPSDGIITTAVYKILESSSTVKDGLYKSYSFYLTSGEKILESCFTFSSINNENVFWPTNVIYYGPYYLFASGKQSISWSIYVGIEGESNFKELSINVNESDEWVSSLSDEYNLSKQMIVLLSKTPFHISNISRPQFSNDILPLMIVKVSFKDNAKFGIIQLNYNEDQNNSNLKNNYSAYYLIPPIYDRIIF